MDSKEKKGLSEIDICDVFITPSIKRAGWDQPTQIRREVTLTLGLVIVRGNMSAIQNIITKPLKSNNQLSQAKTNPSSLM
jgi:type I site-specific restriction endonuclease